MNLLIVDSGNTWLKAAVYAGECVIWEQKLKPNADALPPILEAIEAFGVKAGGYAATTGAAIDPLLQRIDSYFAGAWFAVTGSVGGIVQNRYLTPETLGADRWAAVNAARKTQPTGNILVISAGTAITFDIVNAQNEYLGGAIAPGLQMRFQALQHFTGKLPYVTPSAAPITIGNDTLTSIQAGVQWGYVEEVKGMVVRYLQQLLTQTQPKTEIYSNPDAENSAPNPFIESPISVFLTGGDAQWLQEPLITLTPAQPFLLYTNQRLVLEGVRLLTERYFNYE